MAFSGLKYKRPDHSEIKYKNMRFLITDRPNDGTVNKYIDELNKYGADVVVRVCDSSYNKDPLEESGIKVIVSIFWLLLFLRQQKTFQMSLQTDEAFSIIIKINQTRQNKKIFYKII
jgi:hypothetical protein